MNVALFVFAACEWWLLARRIVININEQASLPGSPTATSFKVELLTRAMHIIASYTASYLRVRS